MDEYIEYIPKEHLLQKVDNIFSELKNVNDNYYINTMDIIIKNSDIINKRVNQLLVEFFNDDQLNIIKEILKICTNFYEYCEVDIYNKVLSIQQLRDENKIPKDLTNEETIKYILSYFKHDKIVELICNNDFCGFYDAYSKFLNELQNYIIYLLEKEVKKLNI